MTGREKTRLNIFLLTETLLYGAVIIPGFYGHVNHPLRYSSILFCAIYSVLLFVERRDRNHRWLCISLVLTAMADFCFEILTSRVLEALFFFVLVQWCHGVRLVLCLPHREKRERTWTIFCAARILGPIVLAAIILGGLLPGTDTYFQLAREMKLASAFMLVYGINILLNQAAAFFGWLRTRSLFALLLTLAFLLFILCDITVAANLLYPYTGLSMGITEGMARLTWVFYIPSQILFAVSGIYYDYSGK